MSQSDYNRILLKFSGEALAGKKGTGIDTDMVEHFTDEIIGAHSLNIQIGIVIGGGNIFRGLNASQQGMNRVRADSMGMLATVINAIAVQDALIRRGVKARVMSAIPMSDFTEMLSVPKAVEYLNNGEIILFCAGTGRPFFSTDTGASLRAAEIGAEILIKGTKVDGVYDKDPKKHDDAIFFDTLDYATAIEKKLGVMDITAFSLCQDNDIPIIICNMLKSGNLKKLLLGQKVGTFISGSKK